MQWPLRCYACTICASGLSCVSRFSSSSSSRDGGMLVHASCRYICFRFCHHHHHHHHHPSPSAVLSFPSVMAFPPCVGLHSRLFFPSAPPLSKMAATMRRASRGATFHLPRCWAWTMCLPTGDAAPAALFAHAHAHTHASLFPFVPLALRLV
jgi:hypothetical protein